jgi:hypothetical protein
MKLTRRQLRRIIQEEKQALVKEWTRTDNDSTVIETVYQNLNSFARALYQDGYDDIAGTIVDQLKLLDPMRRDYLGVSRRQLSRMDRLNEDHT